MNFKAIALALLATSTLAACGKGGAVSDAIDHVKGEAQKDADKSELAGKWASACDQKNLLFSVAGIKSQQTVFDFYSDSGKSVKLYSDDNCQTEIGQATYTGKVTVGAATGGEGSTLLDFDYNKVEVTISNDGIVKLLNLPATPGCGISNWVAGQKRDVTSAAGGLTCPIAKPAQEFDIAKTDGKTLHFGRVDTVHNKATKEARPVELDQNVTFNKQ